MRTEVAPLRRGAKRRIQTRGALLDAGQRLFAKRPIDGVSIDDIVTEADVAKGSFYNHFDDKVGFASAIVEIVQADRERCIFAANNDIADPAERAARALCITLRYALEHPERVQALISLIERRTIPGTPMNTGLTADMTAGIDQGRFRGVTLEGAVLVVMGLITIATSHVALEKTSMPLADLAVSMGHTMLRALGVAEAEALQLARKSADALLPADPA